VFTLDHNPYQTRSYNRRQTADWQAQFIAINRSHSVVIDNPLADLEEIIPEPVSPPSPIRAFPSSAAEHPLFNSSTPRRAPTPRPTPVAMAQPPPAQPAFSGSGPGGNIPLIFNIEEPALSEFKRAWKSYLIRSCANLGVRNTSTGIPEVSPEVQAVPAHSGLFRPGVTRSRMVGRKP